MKIVLTRDIKGLGRMGDIVEASDGYARNFLIRQGFGRALDKISLGQIVKTAEQKQKKIEIANEKSAVAAKRLAGKTFEFSLPADEKGHLYASLKESEIIARIKVREPDIPPDARIVDYSPLKETGERLITLKNNKNFFTQLAVQIKSSPKDGKPVQKLQKQ